jgi:hypothetical protein
LAFDCSRLWRRGLRNGQASHPCPRRRRSPRILNEGEYLCRFLIRDVVGRLRTEEQIARNSHAMPATFASQQAILAQTGERRHRGRDVRCSPSSKSGGRLLFTERSAASDRRRTTFLWSRIGEIYAAQPAIRNNSPNDEGGCAVFSPINLVIIPHRRTFEIFMSANSDILHFSRLRGSFCAASPRLLRLK